MKSRAHTWIHLCVAAALSSTSAEAVRPATLDFQENVRWRLSDRYDQCRGPNETTCLAELRLDLKQRELFQGLANRLSCCGPASVLTEIIQG